VLWLSGTPWSGIGTAKPLWTPKPLFATLSAAFLPRLANHRSSRYSSGRPEGSMSCRIAIPCFLVMAVLLATMAQPLHAEWSWSSLNPFQSKAAKKSSSGRSAKGAKSSFTARSGSSRTKSKSSQDWLTRTTGVLTPWKSKKTQNMRASRVSRSTAATPIKKTKNTKEGTSWFGSWFTSQPEPEFKTVPGWAGAKGVGREND